MTHGERCLRRQRPTPNAQLPTPKGRIRPRSVACFGSWELGVGRWALSPPQASSYFHIGFPSWSKGVILMRQRCVERARVRCVRAGWDKVCADGRGHRGEVRGQGGVPRRVSAASGKGHRALSPARLRGAALTRVVPAGDAAQQPLARDAEPDGDHNAAALRQQRGTAMAGVSTREIHKCAPCCHGAS